MSRDRSSRDVEGRAEKESFMAGALITYGYIVLWICLSAAVILINKYILAYANFPYPIALTLSHMAFCSALAWAIIKMGLVDTAHMDSQTYIRNVLPIAALFSGTLWLGNAAYLYLSVSFIQMLKAIMPVTVFLTGVMLGTERFSCIFFLNIIIVGVGVCIASYGEINFSVIGVLFQSSSIITESFRLCLIQILLQARGIKLNPVTTLYYVAPACFGFLCIPFSVIELPKMMRMDSTVALPYGWLMASAVSAFALNMSVFLLIGRSSALTMNIAGVIKDWLLIMLSMLMYKSPVTTVQFFGYGLAFAGVCWYNYQKLQAMKPAVAAPQKLVNLSPAEQREPLLANKN